MLWSSIDSIIYSSYLFIIINEERTIMGMNVKKTEKEKKIIQFKGEGIE